MTNSIEETVEEIVSNMTKLNRRIDQATGAQREGTD